MPKSKSVTESGIPLYLLPWAIARQITRIGDSVYRISVKRTHWHHYNASVRTKTLPRELAPGSLAGFSLATPPDTGNRGMATGATGGRSG